MAQLIKLASRQDRIQLPGIVDHYHGKRRQDLKVVEMLFI